MDKRNFKERFKDSQNFEDLMTSILTWGGRIGPAGAFPVYTPEQAEAIILGWSNQLEAVGTILLPKVAIEVGV